MNPRSDCNAGPRSGVIVGAGFAGRAIARKLASAPADMLVIDRHNYNRLQPLPIAWLRLGAVHIFPVISFRNRVTVFLNCVCAWFAYGRGAPMIAREERTQAHAPQASPASTQLSGRS